MNDYNRAHFPLDMDDAIFDGFKDALRAGRRAPRGTLTDAATGEAVELSSLWRDAAEMLEFGSFS